MNAREALTHLLNGKKITSKDWEPHEYIFLDSNGKIASDDPSFNYFTVDNDEDYQIYQEPKKKKKLYHALLKSDKIYYNLSSCLYANEEQAKYHNGKEFIKLLEPAIEVEVDE